MATILETHFELDHVDGRIFNDGTCGHGTVQNGTNFAYTPALHGQGWNGKDPISFDASSGAFQGSSWTATISFRENDVSTSSKWMGFHSTYLYDGSYYGWRFRTTGSNSSTVFYLEYGSYGVFKSVSFPSVSLGSHKEIVFVLDSNIVSMYVDTVFHGSVDLTADPITYHATLKTFALNGYWHFSSGWVIIASGPISGYYDSLNFYDYAFTTQDISDLYDYNTTSGVLFNHGSEHLVANSAPETYMDITYRLVLNESLNEAQIEKNFTESDISDFTATDTPVIVSGQITNYNPYTTYFCPAGEVSIASDGTITTDHWGAYLYAIDAYKTISAKALLVS